MDCEDHAGDEMRGTELPDTNLSYDVVNIAYQERLRSAELYRLLRRDAPPRESTLMVWAKGLRDLISRRALQGKRSLAGSADDLPCPEPAGC
jgi:hypothetical protein